MSAGPLRIAAFSALVLLSIAGIWFYVHRPSPAARPRPSPPGPALPAPSAASASPTPAAPAQVIVTPPFASLASPPSPPFLKSVATAGDLRVSFFYEGDDRAASDDIFYTERTAVANQQGEKYVLMPSSIDPADYRYGPTDFSIFRNQESHSYQGIPFSVLNPEAGYSLEYIALKINDARLVGGLSVELGIDYMAADDGDATDTPPAPSSSTGVLRSWFSPTLVYACGPGIYLRPVGTSKLVPVEPVGEITWYKLEKPISLRNLRLNYCDDVAKSKRKKKHKTQAEADDDDDVAAYCAQVKNLASGNLRLHVRYQPNGVAGVLQIQALNFILSDSQGNYYQPTIGQNFAHYYKAYLIDRNCMKSDQPAKCAGG